MSLWVSRVFCLLDLKNLVNCQIQKKSGQLYDGGVLRVGQIETKWLTILDEKNLPRMIFNTAGDTSLIDVYDADGDYRFSFFDIGPGEKAALKLNSTNGAYIELSTHRHSPLISIRDKAGKVAYFGSY